MTSPVLMYHFSIRGLRFVRRPICSPPDDGTLCFVDNGQGWGWTDRQAALFKDGKWTTQNGKDLRFAPAHWTVLDYEAHQHGE